MRRYTAPSPSPDAAPAQDERTSFIQAAADSQLWPGAAAAAELDLAAGGPASDPNEPLPPYDPPAGARSAAASSVASTSGGDLGQATYRIRRLPSASAIPMSSRLRGAGDAAGGGGGAMVRAVRMEVDCSGCR